VTGVQTCALPISSAIIIVVIVTVTLTDLLSQQLRKMAI